MAAWLNYHHLFYFKAIAEEGSVSKAAESFRLGQPTLSSQLKRFEESLGVPLFERRREKTDPPHGAGQNRARLREEHLQDGRGDAGGAA